MGYLNQILHTFISSSCSTTGMQNGDKGMPIIIFAGRFLLVNMLIILSRMVYLNQILHIYRDTCMQNGD